jgi:hypothetical protein
MRLLLGLALMLGGLGGAVLSFSSNIMVSSSLPMINGIQISITLGLFSLVAFLGGVSLMLANN